MLVRITSEELEERSHERHEWKLSTINSITKYNKYRDNHSLNPCPHQFTSEIGHALQFPYNS